MNRIMCSAAAGLSSEVYGFMHQGYEPWLTAAAVGRGSLLMPDIPKYRRFQLLKVRPQSERDFHDFLIQTFKGRLVIKPQHQVGPYFADFLLRASKRKRMLIEIDGGYHTALKQHQIDIQHTDYFVNHGYSVLRLTPEAAQQLTRAQLIDTVKTLLWRRTVRWLGVEHIECPNDPAEQFRRMMQ